MKVTVTNEDIRDGLRDDPCFCPVARACQRALGDSNKERARVWKDRVVTTHNHYSFRDASPPIREMKFDRTVADFIYDFDNRDLGDKPLPSFEFDLELEKMSYNKGANL